MQLVCPWTNVFSAGGLIPSNKSIQESVARVQTFGIETAHAFQELEMFAVMLRDIVGAENEQRRQNGYG